DDKVVAAWNGLAIAALADCGVLFDRPDLVDAATRCAALLADLHVVDGRLRRVSRDGVVGEPVGAPEDYADVAEGPLALHQARGEPPRLAPAAALPAGPVEVAVVDGPELAAVARRGTSAGAVVGTGGRPPLLTDRPAGAAYVCQGFVCDAPIRDAAELAARIKAVAIRD